MKKNPGGRPGIKSWEAICLYQLWDETIKDFSDAQKLMNKTEDGNSTMYFDNEEQVKQSLEDLQLKCKIRYTIFIRLNDAYYIMQPAAPVKIDYTHMKEEVVEENTDAEAASFQAAEEETIDDIQDYNEELEENINELPE